MNVLSTSSGRVFRGTVLLTPALPTLEFPKYTGPSVLATLLYELHFSGQVMNFAAA